MKGYYIVGCHYEHGYHEEVFEFFRLGDEHELTKKLVQLMRGVGKGQFGFREEELHVIKGSEISFTTEKEIVKIVELGDERR